MIADRISNAARAGTACATARPTPPPESEDRLLAAQAANAKAAMVRTVQDMGATLLEVVDVRAWVLRHPWLAVGSAVTVGFVAGKVLTPAARDRTNHRKSHAKADGDSDRREQDAPRGRMAFLFAASGKFLTGILLAMIQRAIAASVVPQEPPPAETPSSP